MISSSQALIGIPESLREPLLEEYRAINQAFMEQKWLPTELSAGRFCEIVYSILIGFSSGNYPSVPSKPSNFSQACRQLENNTNVPRSFQILIPRLLPALYEIRNNRGVGHVGGDVDPNYMDSVTAISMASWIIGELIRVFHKTSIDEAQEIVGLLVERKVPFIWQSGSTKRILDPNLKLKDQVLVLIANSSSPTSFQDLLSWTEYKNPSYLKKLLQDLHKNRFVEMNPDGQIIQILPPGSKRVDQVLESVFQIKLN